MTTSQSRRDIVRESDDEEPPRRASLTGHEVTGPDGGPAVAIGAPGVSKVTIGLHIAGDGAFLLADEDDLIELEEAR